MTIVSAALLLFLVLDPLGNILLMLSALKNVAPERHRKVILREMLIALAALLIFLFLGSHFLSALGLSEQALGMAGGMVLMLVALRMVFPTPDNSLEEQTSSEPFIVPIAIPYVAGPSSLATVLLMMSREPARWANWALAIVLAWGACVPILLAASYLSRVLGKRGLTAVERLMGLVLVTIAVQMLMTGAAQFITRFH